MRKWILSGAVAVLSLALAGVALAAFTQTASVKFTVGKPGKSTGISANLIATDTTNFVPQATKKLTIDFPAGTRFNLKTPKLKLCTRTDKQLRDQFGPKCPKSSYIASGTGAFSSYPIPSGLTSTPYTIPTSVKAYLGRGNIILVVRGTVVAYKSWIYVLHAKASASTLTIAVPRMIRGRKLPFKGVQVSLTTIKLTIPAIGSGSKALVTSGTCTAHKFVVTTHLLYYKGPKLTIKSTSPCG
jgi:hypothetical protein